MKKDRDETSKRIPWRKPRLEGLQTGDAPLCNPAFPQAQVCASNGFPQSSAGCAVKGTFS